MATTVPRLRPSLRKHAPRIDHEERLWATGADLVAGVDEVGRGAWAGPLTIGAVVIPKDRRIYKIRDSKQLTEPEREAMFDRIASWAGRWSVGHASPAECDELGMSEAQKLAARRALDGLGVPVDHVLVDGTWDFIGREPVTTIVKGDQKSLSIAAASVLAKVTRDRMMRTMANEFPWYAFESNKGYPCPRHRAALAAYGPTPLHRRSWVFMDNQPWSGVKRVAPAGQERLF